jgi:hypothetical protein
MNEPEVEWKDVIAFKSSLERCLIRWPYRHAQETSTHKRWRLRANVVRRFRLYADALPIEFGMTRAYFAAEDAMYAAHAKMIKEKHEREMDFLCGKRKTSPPWGC